MILFSVSADVWEDSHAGLHPDQPKQQLPDFSSGGSPPLQVRSFFMWLFSSAQMKESLSVYPCMFSGVLQARRGRKSCWPAFQGSAVTRSRTTNRERSSAAAATSPSFTSSASLCCVPSWWGNPNPQIFPEYPESLCPDQKLISHLILYLDHQPICCRHHGQL